MKQKIDQLIAKWTCKFKGHEMEYDGRIRLVRLTDDPWLEFIDGLPAGRGVACTRCGHLGVVPHEPKVGPKP